MPDEDYLLKSGRHHVDNQFVGHVVEIERGGVAAALLAAAWNVQGEHAAQSSGILPSKRSDGLLPDPAALSAAMYEGEVGRHVSPQTNAARPDDPP
jgi:hypothetical protein